MSPAQAADETDWNVPPRRAQRRDHGRLEARQHALAAHAAGSKLAHEIVVRRNHAVDPAEVETRRQGRGGPCRNTAAPGAHGTQPRAEIAEIGADPEHVRTEAADLLGRQLQLPPGLGKLDTRLPGPGPLQRGGVGHDDVHVVAQLGQPPADRRWPPETVVQQLPQLFSVALPGQGRARSVERLEVAVVERPQQLDPHADARPAA